jgi:hypothetical protein
MEDGATSQLGVLGVALLAIEKRFQRNARLNDSSCLIKEHRSSGGPVRLTFLIVTIEYSIIFLT